MDYELIWWIVTTIVAYGTMWLLLKMHYCPCVESIADGDWE